MSESERPRERLLNHGVKQLASAELLAILLGTGQGAGKLSAVGLGQLILQTIGAGYDDPVASLQAVTVQELMAIPGVGPAKATAILAAIELGNRAFFAKPPERAEITDPSIAAAALSQELMWQEQEKLAILMLDGRNRIITKQVLTIGTATETLAHPRDIFKAALKGGAVKLIVAHNHPSGNTEPSAEDIQLTGQLLEAGAVLGMPLLDHLILGNGSFTSMHEATTVWQKFAARNPCPASP